MSSIYISIFSILRHVDYGGEMRLATSKIGGEGRFLDWQGIIFLLFYNFWNNLIDPNSEVYTFLSATYLYLSFHDYWFPEWKVSGFLSCQKSKYFPVYYSHQFRVYW